MCTTVVLSLLAVMSASGVERRDGLRVHRGKTDPRGEFAFAVLLQRTENPFSRLCSGSLIAFNWVLTACHCLSESAGPFVIRYGDFTVPANETKLYTNVINTFIHPNCMAKEFTDSMSLLVLRNDIGLVLVEKVPKKHAKLLAMDYKTLTGLPTKYAGFGSTSEYFPTDKTRLQTMPLQVGEGVIVSCHLNLMKFNLKLMLIRKGPVVCMTPKCSDRWQGPRAGDSGGPFIYNGRIIGVLSGGIPKIINFFTPVSVYLEWIKQVMQSNG